MNFHLNTFFYPKSVLVAGASTKEKSIGYEFLNTMLSYGYKGRILPVNPRADTILGLKCYHSIEEIQEPVDLAIVLVPKACCEETIDGLLSMGVRSLILITAGFKEVGSEGEKVEKSIVEKIRASGARLVGPNCMGIINTESEVKLNATFVAEKPEHGSMGFLSQSGALGAAVLNSLRETDIRFAHFISVGNKADINENDVLRYWQDNPGIHTLTFYLESFTNGYEFISPFIEGEVTKPAIILKAGKTSGGMKAASSHTGALGSTDKVVEAVLNQFGIIRVNDLNELFNTAKGFESFPLPKGNKVAVVTNAGGPAILAVDALERENLKLAELSPETRQKLREIVHPEGSVENPVDLLPGGSAEAYRAVNEILLADENVDAVISIFVEPVMVKPFRVVEEVSEIKSEKPLLQVYMPLPEFWDLYRSKPGNRIPLFRNPEDPAEVISNMLFFRKRRFRIEKSLQSRLKEKNATGMDKYKFQAGYLRQDEVMRVIQDYNIPVIKSILLKPEELEKLPENYLPAVLKGISREVIHKSEFNAVRLNLGTKAEVLSEARKMMEEFGRQNFTIDSFLIQPYVKIRHEILLGGFRDPSFGPMIMFGTGGKYVEVINDTVIKSAFMSDADVNEMIKKTKMGQIIKGVRGENPADIRCLREVIKSAARMMIENHRIEEFDINPLVVAENDAVYALDIRIKMGK
ncbi:MAG: acetyl-CoA synthetase [Ignavibacteria bacterium]|jgi:acetyltransferase|nr:acetyl-CoA synthetase [Ignavibacteria bacterium]MCU7503393.1 acetyl-CoA synthetase [Ignavibacteria bacterium]MCU7516275.1 acetyl-CoA synthetase [Ignavibacteria bacterium]